MSEQQETDVTKTEEYKALEDLWLGHEEILEILADINTGVWEDRITGNSTEETE